MLHAMTRLLHRFGLCLLVSLIAGCGASTTPAQPSSTDPPAVPPDEQVGVVGELSILQDSATADEPSTSDDPQQADQPSIPRSEIQRVIREATGQVRYCYERALAREPTLEGTVRVRFVIAPDGSVTSASVTSSTVGKPDMEECVLQRVRALAFPPPDNGADVTVNYPFRFQHTGN